MYNSYKSVFKVVCINNKYNSGQIIDGLELDKIYTVTEVHGKYGEDSYYTILELDGLIYDSLWFKPVVEYRRLKNRKN